jgi:2',3'-cyclic-nucleotide 2'-phosphodiesterase (5'-nucleotidase family)/predicted AlkP superfamily phosphohydrolase/phosphomutase
MKQGGVTRRRRARPWGRIAAAAFVAVVVSQVPATISAAKNDKGNGNQRDQKVLLFASDGMRQDLIEQYVAQRELPGFAELLKRGAAATDGGMLTQAPPNTGAGWYTMATGAWPAVHGSTNNTFAVNGQPFANSTASFNAGILRAETIAQSAERGGKKVIQMEWAGGRNGTIDGPTVDFRSFFSGRGVATTQLKPTDSVSLATQFGVQLDVSPTAPASGWTNAPQSFSPSLEMHMRVLDFGIDKYGVNAYIYDSRNDGKVNYDRVLFTLAPSKDGAQKVADVKAGELADVKVKIVGGALAGLTGGMLVKVETLSADGTDVRLYHSSVSRANVSWPSWPGEPGFTGDFAEFVAQRFATSQAGDFAIIESGIVSEDTYMQQALYWEKLHQPLLKYLIETYHPDLALVGYPGTDEVSHQFLGLISPKLPNGEANPAYDDLNLDGVKDGLVKKRQGYLLDAYRGADATMRLAQDLLDGKGRDKADVTTFVGSDHGFAPQFLAIDASKVLVDLHYLSKPQTANCRPAVGETIGKAKVCWAGGTAQVYLNLAGRDPAGGGFTQVPSTQATTAVNEIRAAFSAIKDTNDWTHDGQPETNWTVIDRTFTKAEARYIPNGPGTTADMAHPTRTGDLVVFAYPPYQFDAATPGTLIAPSLFFGQHGYVPDVQNLDASVNMRSTFLAGGDAIKHGRFTVSSIDIAPTIAYLMRVPEPQQSQGRVLLELLNDAGDVKPISIIGINDFHGQLDPTTLAYDNLAQPVGGAGQLATMFDEDAARLPGPALLLAAGDNVGASPPNSSLLEDKPAIDVENAWGLDATSYGNHEFDYGVERLLMHQARAHFPFLATNIVLEGTTQPPTWVKTSEVFNVNGVRVGVIGAELKATKELVSAGATAGLEFLDEATRIKAESEKLRAEGVDVQVVVIHQGTERGSNRIDGTAAATWEGPIMGIAQALQGTTVDTIIAGHTHRVSNLMVGNILVTEGINAGTSYSVLQMMVKDGDVQWVGGATRVAKDIGVTPRPDVQAIVNQANADTAVLRNQVIGSATIDLLRDLNRFRESVMGDLVTDAMRLKYPGVEAAVTNSGGLRQSIRQSPPSAGEHDGEITWGEVFAVLPFGNRTVIETITGDQLRAALVNGFTPFCDPNFTGGTGRNPQVSGLSIAFTCNSTTPVVTQMAKIVDFTTGATQAINAGDTVRIVTNDFMFTGGDGYTAFSNGTDVQQPGDALLDVVVDYIKATSPLMTAPTSGRITAPPPPPDSNPG